MESVLFLRNVKDISSSSLEKDQVHIVNFELSDRKFENQLKIFISEESLGKLNQLIATLSSIERELLTQTEGE